MVTGATESILVRLLATGVWLIGFNVATARAADTLVQDAGELRQAASQAKPGTRILLAAGTYSGGFYFSNLQGETNLPIILAAADPAHPPVFQGPTGMHFSRPAFLELHDLVISNASVNGLNIDDGGALDAPLTMWSCAG